MLKSHPKLTKMCQNRSRFSEISCNLVRACIDMLRLVFLSLVHEKCVSVRVITLFLQFLSLHLPRQCMLISSVLSGPLVSTGIYIFRKAPARQAAGGVFYGYPSGEY